MGFGIKRKIRDCLISYYRNKDISDERKIERQHNIEMFIPSCRMELTADEISEFENLWGGIISNNNYSELEIYKYYYGFNPCVLGYDQYLPLISRRLNDYYYTKYYENKCLTDILCSCIKSPSVICRCINGELYNSKLEQSSFADVFETAINENSSIIIKPSVESSGGKNIEIIGSRCFPSDKNSLLRSFGLNFVAQKVISQHKQMAFFNESSVNTLRISSLYLNGVVTITNCELRFGKTGSSVDNFKSGGFFIGVKEDGYLRDFAFGSSFDKVYEYKGKQFKDICLSFIPKVYETIKHSHVKDFPLCKFIGWDIAIDENEDPILIEINSSQHGIFSEQLANGVGVFNGREHEVIEYIKEKEFKYGRSLLEY